ncbi:molybdenum cofactor guanylyltransferase [uncultured Fibrella sp.]|uniref:molybdenum cofactor guanylyltransferase n=1 Tax=uncultured Fibrella sp. TaxID=1284596 RepID=UPI0035CAB789
MKGDANSADNVPAKAAAPVYGLLLMGGQSTRMGQDKSALDYHGKPQREHLTEMLSTRCESVYWSVNTGQFNTLTYNRMVLDAYSETGPLGGLLTALEAFPDVAWLIVPCDLPQLDSGTLQYLLSNRNSETLVTAFWNADHTGAEPLVSLWEPSAGPVLRAWFQAGNRSPRRFLATHPVTLIDVPDVRVFENVNDWVGYLTHKHSTPAS